VIPGPRPSTGQHRPGSGRDRSADDVRPLRPVPVADATDQDPDPATPPPACPVALQRSPRGWAVISPVGTEPVADLVEGMSLADLVAQEFGVPLEPDRTTRRSARGPVEEAGVGADAVDARVSALERTVAQLEHALAARVSTERAIGVLAERYGTDCRAAFEALRRDARSQGRPVADLAREVLECLAVASADAPPQEVPAVLPPGPRPPCPVEAGRQPPPVLADAQAADGRS
jgi:hypothetical protein